MLDEVLIYIFNICLYYARFFRWCQKKIKSIGNRGNGFYYSILLLLYYYLYIYIKYKYNIYICIFFVMKLYDPIYTHGYTVENIIKIYSIVESIPTIWQFAPHFLHESQYNIWMPNYIYTMSNLTKNMFTKKNFASSSPYLRYKMQLSFQSFPESLKSRYANLTKYPLPYPIFYW